MDQSLTPPAHRSYTPAQPEQKKPWAAIIIVGLLGAALTISTLTGLMEDWESSTVALTLAGIVGLLILVGLVFWDIRIGLAAFLVASALSPRMGTNFRLTDAVVPFLIVVWGGKILCGERAVFRTPMSVPILLVSLTMILSTLYGAGIATIPNWEPSTFLIGKRLEYFFIFYLTLNITQDRRWARALLVIFIVGAVFAALVSLAGAQHSTELGTTRAMGFDEGNYNTFSGFMVMAVALAVAGALDAKNRWLRITLAGCALLFIVAILKSYSREGYVILALALVAIGFMRYRGIIPVLVAAVLLSPILFPNTVIERVFDTIHQVQNYQTESPGGNSYAARVSAWQWRWDGWITKHPWAGNGVGSVELSVDNEYVLRWAESGIVGLGFFLLLLASMGRYLWRCAKTLRGTEMEPFAYGLMAGFLALVLQGWVAATWTTIRTMEPFWVLLGVIGGAAMAIQKGDGGRETGDGGPEAGDRETAPEGRRLYAGA